MFSGTVIFTVLFFHSFCIVQSGRVKRVIGGEDVACDTQRHIASLRQSRSLKHLCGATLLSPRVALTAAHCVTQPALEYALQLNNFCDEEPVRGEVLEIIVHELYDEFTLAHDIALMKVKLSINDTTWLNKSTLPTSTFGLSGDCTTYGYGYKEKQTKKNWETLLAGQMSIISLDECLKRLGPYVAPKPDRGMLCAMGNGVDSCEGDSGGPLVCDGVLEAVSSYGMSCAVPGLPGVFTSIGAHLQWIQKHLRTT